MSNNPLNGKSILFFAPSFFDYEIKIRDKMIELGANVDFFDERSINKSWQKALLKINPKIFSNKTKKYYSNILNKCKNKKYDYVLIIKCEMIPVSILKMIKSYYIDAKLILYLYDSLSNIKGINDKLDYFDRIYSFDRQDCEKYNFHFRPLFFCDEYKYNRNKFHEYIYDICFIGTIHSDRYKILKKIKVLADSNNLSFYMYPFLQSRFMYYFYRIINKEFKDTKITDFQFDKITSSEIKEIVDSSRVIVDIQHPKQTGLTMRTIEMIGMGKKLITTNKDIVNYDFYDSNNIQIIDRERLELNLGTFLEENMNKKNIDNYSLKYWVLEVLNYVK